MGLNRREFLWLSGASLGTLLLGKPAMAQKTGQAMLYDTSKCVGCMVCARKCPVTCIAGARREAHVIDQSRCIKCGMCFDVCRFDAVERL